MIVSSNSNYTIQVEFEKDCAEISFVGMGHPSPHEFNHYNHVLNISSNAWLVDRGNKWDGRNLPADRKTDITKGEIDFLISSFGENINTLTVLDLKNISKEITTCIDWLFRIGYKKVSFSSMDWGRYIATKRILRPFYKRADMRVEEKACHHIVEGMFYDNGDFEGKITLENI